MKETSNTVQYKGMRIEKAQGTLNEFGCKGDGLNYSGRLDMIEVNLAACDLSLFFCPLCKILFS